MKQTTKGILWIASPFIGMIGILFAWAMVSMLAPISGASAGGAAVLVFKIVNVVLGFLGILVMLFIPIGVIVGIIQLTKKEANPSTPSEPVQHP